MNYARYDVTTVIAAHLVLSDSTTTDVLIELGYRSSDPFAIHAYFTAGDSTSAWLLARDLVCAGLAATQETVAGEGDVRMWRDENPEYVLIALTGTPGTALIAASADPVEHFLDQTRSLVPLGAEADLVDQAIVALVANILAA